MDPCSTFCNVTQKLADISTRANLLEFVLKSPFLPYNGQYQIKVIEHSLLTDTASGEVVGFEQPGKFTLKKFWNWSRNVHALTSGWVSGSNASQKKDTAEKVKKYARPWAWDKNIFSMQFLSHENDGSERRRNRKPHVKQKRLSVKISRHTRIGVSAF